MISSGSSGRRAGAPPDQPPVDHPEGGDGVAVTVGSVTVGTGAVAVADGVTRGVGEGTRDGVGDGVGVRDGVADGVTRGVTTGAGAGALCTAAAGSGRTSA